MFQMWCKNLEYEPDVFTSNDSFVLLGKVYLKTGMHMNIYFIAAS